MKTARWTDRRGWHWFFKQPETTREVTDGALVAISPLRRCGLDGRLPTSDQMWPLLEWLSALCVRVEVDGECVEGLDADQWSDVIDEELTLLQWLDAHNAIIESVSIAEDVLEDIRTYFAIAYDGGCECPRCMEIETKRRIECRYDVVGAEAHHWVHRYAILSDDPILSAPYWVYQVKTIERIALGKKRKKNKSKFDNVDRKKGINEYLKKKGQWN